MCARNRTRRWPRCRPPRIFLSIANESSPVILISGGPPGIVIHRIIAIVGWNRRNRSARNLRTGLHPIQRCVDDPRDRCADEGGLKRCRFGTRVDQEEGGGGDFFLIFLLRFCWIRGRGKLKSLKNGIFNTWMGK